MAHSRGTIMGERSGGNTKYAQWATAGSAIFLRRSALIRLKLAIDFLESPAINRLRAAAWLRWNLTRACRLPLRSPGSTDMLIKSIAAIALLIAASDGAPASDKPAHRFSCTLVRLYVAKYSLPAAESWARSHGATDVEIETARQCLGSSVQTASFATSR